MSPAARDRLASRRRVVCSRVLADEAEEEQTGGARARKLREQQRAARRPAAVYQAGVKRRLRGRWFHLVPAHSHQISIVFVCLGLLVAGLITAGYLSVVWPPVALRPLVGRPFRLDIPGGIADWVGSQMLALSAGFAILIYQLRRYRGDDYHGRYRMWRPIVVLLLLLSLDAVTHLRAAIAATIDATWGQQAVIAGDDVVRLLLLLAGAAVGLPLIAELHRSFSSIACFFGALGMLALPTALRVHLIDVPPELMATWSGAARLTGRALVLGATICYLRMLFREVRGMDAESEALWMRAGSITKWFRKSAEADEKPIKRNQKRSEDAEESEPEKKTGFFAALFGRGRNGEDNEQDPLARRRKSRKAEAAEEDAEDESYDSEDAEEDYEEDDDESSSARRPQPAITKSSQPVANSPRPLHSPPPVPSRSLPARQQRRKVKPIPMFQQSLRQKQGVPTKQKPNVVAGAGSVDAKNPKRLRKTPQEPLRQNRRPKKNPASPSQRPKRPKIQTRLPRKAGSAAADLKRPQKVTHNPKTSPLPNLPSLSNLRPKRKPIRQKQLLQNEVGSVGDATSPIVKKHLCSKRPILSQPPTRVRSNPIPRARLLSQPNHRQQLLHLPIPMTMKMRMTMETATMETAA